MNCVHPLAVSDRTVQQVPAAQHPIFTAQPGKCRTLHVRFEANVAPTRMYLNCYVSLDGVGNGDPIAVIRVDGETKETVARPRRCRDGPANGPSNPAEGSRDDGGCAGGQTLAVGDEQSFRLPFESLSAGGAGGRTR